MSQIKLFLYAKCSTCRKADALLTASGLEIYRQDIFKQRLSAEEIRDLLRETGMGLPEVLSTRSIPYRELELAAREVSEDDLIGLIAEYPGLLKRPIVISGDEVVVGFDQAAYERVIERAGAT